MAKKRRGKGTGRQLDVADLVELVQAMSSIRNGHATTTTALTDPSANVEKRVDLQAAHDKELRKITERWQQRFDTERQRANDAKADKESLRVDARFGELQTQALTLVNTVATTAKAASDAVAAAALQQTEAMNQMREIVTTLGTTVTSIVSAGGARQATTVEAVATSRYGSERLIQWVGAIVGMGVLAATIIYTVHAVTGH